MSLPRLDLLDRYSRLQTGVRMADLWPTRADGLCACGCGKKLSGRRTRWASNECGERAWVVYAVRTGRSSTIRGELFKRDGGTCAACGLLCGVRIQGPQTFRSRFAVLRSIGWEADHIIPVVDGGGGCGLENFQTLCIECHKRKTATVARERAEERRADPAQADLLEGVR